MQAWKRERFVRGWAALLTLLALAGALHHLGAADEGGDGEPKSVRLKLYHIAGAKTGSASIDETIKFLKNILAAFPQFDTFKLLDSPEATLEPKQPQQFIAGKYITSVTLEGFAQVRDGADKMVWKATLKIECKLAAAIIHNPTVRIEPGGQHTWEQDAHIFVLQQLNK